ncbi:MAG: hypothetical protein LBE09_03720 [Christensenellaceae bacterium]|nr:hypothetical protein [Christensenellaceae bacterium]
MNGTSKRGRTTKSFHIIDIMVKVRFLQNRTRNNAFRGNVRWRGSKKTGVAE